MRLNLTNIFLNRRIFLWILLLVNVLICNAQTEQSYKQFLNLESDVLYEKGLSYRKGGLDIDSALVCFTIIGNRANKSKEEQEHELCIKAYIEMAYIWFFDYFDYPKAVENMVKAKELMDKWGIDPPIYHLYNGLIYTSLSNQVKDDKTRETAMHYLRQAFNSAIATGDTHLVNMAFSNMLSNAFIMNNISSIDLESKRLLDFSKSVNDSRELYYTYFNIQTLKGLKALTQKHHDEAIEAFNCVIDSLPGNKAYSRYLCGTEEFKGFVYSDVKKYREAETAFKSALNIADNNNLRDARLEILYDLANLYRQWNRQSDYIEYQTKYINIKDSLLSFRKISSMDEIRFISDIRKIENNLQEMENHNERIKRTLTICIVLLVMAVAIIWFTIWFNRKLKRTNRTLYLNNQEILKAEDEERRLRTRYEAEIKELRLQVNNNEVVQHFSSSRTTEKYKGSNLTEEIKLGIAEKIRNVLETSSEIFSTTFSSETMAELVGEKYKYISQVINEKWGVNFNQLLNKYRIREACKRLMDREHYGHLTIEGLAESVGFNSRSTFTSQFKANTGLTPSQYIAESKKSS